MLVYYFLLVILLNQEYKMLIFDNILHILMKNYSLNLDSMIFHFILECLLTNNIQIQENNLKQ